MHVGPKARLAPTLDSCLEKTAQLLQLHGGYHMSQDGMFVQSKQLTQSHGLEFEELGSDCVLLPSFVLESRG